MSNIFTILPKDKKHGILQHFYFIYDNFASFKGSSYYLDYKNESVILDLENICNQKEIYKSYTKEKANKKRTISDHKINQLKIDNDKLNNWI